MQYVVQVPQCLIHTVDLDTLLMLHTIFHLLHSKQVRLCPSHVTMMCAKWSLLGPGIPLPACLAAGAHRVRSLCSLQLLHSAEMEKKKQKT